MSQADRDQEVSEDVEAPAARPATGVAMTQYARVPPKSSKEGDVSHLLGTVVADRYQINRLLGVGGMGAVFEAEHVHMKKLVALKILHSRMLSRPEVVARFEREAVAAGRLQHPGIVGATDFGRLEEGSFYLTLEHVDGCSLAKLLETEGALTPERALIIAVQINLALCAAHAAGIVHRDLKPDNIMLVRTGDDEDFVKVLDFGIAKLRLDEDEGESITRAGLVFGTPEYMSPEQAMGHEADARSDLYGLGMVLYEMCAGKSPFRHEELTAILTAQITEPPPPLPSHVPELLARLIYCLLEKDPQDRPQSADELAEDLMIVADKMGWTLPAPRTSAGTRLDIAGAVGTSRVGRAARLGSGALESLRSFSVRPVSIGNKKVPRFIPVLALLAGAGVGALVMLGTRPERQRDLPAAAPPPPPPIVDAEQQLLAAARTGDRDAISKLRKLVSAKQKELIAEGHIASDPKASDPKASDPTVSAARAGTESPTGSESPAVAPSSASGDPAQAQPTSKGASDDAAQPAASNALSEAAKPASSSIPGAAPSTTVIAAARTPGAEDPVLQQANRYMALGRGYSVIKHAPAALQMYEQAVLLDPHLADDSELLVDVRTALGAQDAVTEGLEFASSYLGAHGADLIYDVYLDYLGEVGMTPVVARAMKLVQSPEFMEQASPSLQVALRLADARVCTDYRKILEDAAAHADDRSVQKLRALTTRRGCGTFGNKDCFACLRSPDVPLEQAVLRAETHPSPVFLTPSEAAKEERAAAPPLNTP